MKKSFLTGLVILLPLILTFILIVFIFDLFSSPFLDTVTNFLSKQQNIIPFFESEDVVIFISRIIILIFFFLFILFIGALGQWFVIKTLLEWGNAIFLKIPIVKSIYHTVKDLIHAIVSLDERKAFVHPVMINFPSDKSLCLGFLSGKVPNECLKATNKKLISVLMPTAPHPIAGYLLFIPEDRVYKIDMTNEDLIKFTVSCGVITPENKNLMDGESDEKTTS